jgi:hypothetical protein
MNYYPNCRRALATALSVSIGFEAVAIGAEDLCWPRPGVISLCVRSEAALPHTEFPDQASPLLLSLSAPVASVASTGSTQVQMYAQREVVV